VPVRLAECLRARTTEAVHRMVSAIVEDIPFYRELASDQLRSEVAEVCRRNLAVYLRCAREGRPPAEQELDEVREPAARRAEEGVPLDAVLLAWEVGNRVTWELLAEAAGPDDLDELVAATRHLRQFLHSYVSVVTETYIAERNAIEREAGGGMRALTEQLLCGREGAALAERVGVRLAVAWVLVAVALPLDADERRGGLPGQIATRRKLRRLQGRLDAYANEPVLSSIGALGGVVLLPVRADPYDPPRLRALVRELAAVTVGPVRAAAARADSPAALPSAAKLAGDLLAVAGALSLPSGLYLLDELLLELPLLYAEEPRRRLAALLRPAEAVPELLPTLQAWLSHDRNRRETAEALYVHANTLDRRLERLTSLTGLDLSTARGMATAQAALAARALERAGVPAEARATLVDGTTPSSGPTECPV
jgi:hypothetical protein